MADPFVSPATAMLPGYSHCLAVETLIHRSRYLKIESLSFNASSIQLCPQSKKALTSHEQQTLVDRFPACQFYLHANLNLGGGFMPFDAAHFDLNASWCLDYVSRLKEALLLFQCPYYSWHADGGSGLNASFEMVCDNTLRLQDYLGLPVAIEGLYPHRPRWALSSFSDYERLLSRDVYFVIDLSHLKICASAEPCPSTLVFDLLIHQNCLEIHLSDNNGIHDSHQKYVQTPFGWEDFQKASLLWVKPPKVFSEINLLGLSKTR